ncbi:MAG: hemolysin III family protein [Anaerolineae bacterium]
MKALRTLAGRFREPWSGLTHLAGLAAALVGLGLLLASAARSAPGDTLRMASLLVYGLSLVLMFAASSTLHLYNGSQRATQLLNRIDHAAIYVLIAGSYTPVCVNLLEGFWRLGMLVIVWALAAAGIAYKLLIFRHDSIISTLFYLGMGWMALLALPQIVRVFDAAGLALLVGGGALYSTGAIFYSIESREVFTGFGWHEVWHLFVLAGSTLHYLLILLYVA